MERTWPRISSVAVRFTVLTVLLLQVAHRSQDSFRASGKCHSLGLRCSGATSFNYHPPIALPGKTCFDTNIAEQRTAIPPFVLRLFLTDWIACILWLMLGPCIRQAMPVLQAVASICAIAPADGNRRGNKEWEGGSVTIIVATARGILYEYAVHNLQGPQAPTCALEQECYLLRNPM